MKITTRKEIQESRSRREVGLGLAVLAGLLAIGMLTLRCQEEERAGPVRLPPAPKRVLFRVEPRQAPQLLVVLTDPSGLQQVLEPFTPVELELEGKIFWTVTASGYRSRTGSFEVPYGESLAPVEVAVELESLVRRRAPPGRRGRIDAKGRR